MFKFVTNLLIHKQLGFEEGQINLFGEPIIMFPAYCAVDTLKELEKKGAQNLLYYSFKELGIKWTTNMIKKYEIKRSDVFNVGSSVIAMAGYGTVKTVKANPESKFIQFQLWKSTLAKLYGKSDHPIDHLFRGMAAGCMCVAYDAELDGVETACSAMGAPYCEIIVKPTKSFDYSNPLVKDQLKKE